MTLLGSKMHSRSNSTKRMEHSIISFGNSSQYAAGGPSACGLASVNAVRTILTACARGDSVRLALDQEETAMSIMAICKYWKSNQHLDVQDILNLPLFQCTVETVEVEDNQSTLANFRKLARSLTRGGACGAVVTRSPEIVSIMNIPDKQEKDGSIIVIFDSHPRPEHPLGAAFLLFYNPDDAATYLSKLFEVDASIMRDNNWQTQMLSRYSAHIMRARPYTEEQDIKAVYDANIKLLKTSVAINEALIREREVQSEVGELRQKLERQKAVRQQASSAEAEAEKKLRALRKELESAREFAKSISDTVSLPQDRLVERSPPVYHRQSNSQSGKNAADVKEKGRVVEPERFFGSTQTPTAPARVSSPPQARSVVAGSEAEEYERVRLAGLAAKSAEKRQQMQAQQSASKIQSQLEAERRDREAALEEAARQQARIDAELRDAEIARRLQEEDEEFLTQHSKLLLMEDQGFECQICLDQWSVGMMSKLESCGHVICRECMVNHIKAELEQRRWPVNCSLCRASSNPTGGGEQGVITRDVCELAGADEELIEMWRQVELASVSVTVECPKCHKVFPVMKEDFSESPMLWCASTDCDSYWCKACSQQAERDQKHTCDGQAELERWKLEQKDVRDCPGCKTSIQRNQGCRHMTCIAPGCNTHFCDTCGGLIIKSRAKAEIDAALSNHYAHCTLFDEYPGR